MQTEKRVVKETKLCFDPTIINDILARIDTDPEVAPKGLAQIAFYNQMINTLRYNGEMIEVSIEREFAVTDTPPQAPPVVTEPSEGTPVWTDEAE